MIVHFCSRPLLQKQECLFKWQHFFSCHVWASSSLQCFRNENGIRISFFFSSVSMQAAGCQRTRNLCCLLQKKQFVFSPTHTLRWQTKKTFSLFFASQLTPPTSFLIFLGSHHRIAFRGKSRIEQHASMISNFKKNYCNFFLVKKSRFSPFVFLCYGNPSPSNFRNFLLLLPLPAPSRQARKKGM